MSKKFDAKVIPAMIGVIVVSLVLAVILNIATRPDCLRHEYIFCGTEAMVHGHEEGAAAEGAFKADHAGPEGAHGAQPH
jgi:hypothetical protein